MMQTKLLSILSIVSAAILVSGAIQSSAIAYSQQKQGYSPQNTMVQPGLYAFGTIASLQNDENGNPTWIVSGLWEGSLTNKTQGGEGNQTGTTVNASAATASLPNGNDKWICYA